MSSIITMRTITEGSRQYLAQMIRYMIGNMSFAI